MVAIHVHASQVDKRGEPYLLHVVRVVEAVSDEAKVVAALHDVREDGGERGSRAVLALDLTEAERVALALLTRDASCSYESYIAAINSRPTVDLAREVKLADLRDNLGRIPHPESADPLLGFSPVTRDALAAKWASLKARYERAIATLGGVR